MRVGFSQLVVPGNVGQLSQRREYAKTVNQAEVAFSANLTKPRKTFLAGVIGLLTAVSGCAKHATIEETKKQVQSEQLQSLTRAGKLEYLCTIAGIVPKEKVATKLSINAIPGEFCLGARDFVNGTDNFEHSVGVFKNDGSFQRLKETVIDQPDKYKQSFAYLQGLKKAESESPAGSYFVQVKCVQK